MPSNEGDALEPELDRAKKDLAAALDEACQADVKRANTGELIRIEEVLAIANEAAKTAVSIRRRRSRQRNEVAAGGAAGGQADAAPRVAAAESGAPASSPREIDLLAGHRAFRDSAGVSWEAFAVYPSTDVGGRSRLPEPYRSGWLAFECEQEKRRLSPVPEGWRTLTDTALLELCESAERVRRRARTGERPPSDG